MDATMVQLQLACCVELCCASFGNVKAALGASKMPWHAPAYDTHTRYHYALEGSDHSCSGGLHLGSCWDLLTTILLPPKKERKVAPKREQDSARAHENATTHATERISVGLFFLIVQFPTRIDCRREGARYLQSIPKNNLFNKNTPLCTETLGHAAQLNL